MTRGEAQGRYVARVLKMNGINPIGMTPADVAETFCMLPAPRVSFEEWCANMGITIELSETEMAQANDKGIEFLKNIGVADPSK